jgi:hypothetical protein
MSVKCDVCDDEIALIRCDECSMNLCKLDNIEVHKPAKLSAHARRPILPPKPIECELCEVAPAQVSCAECEQSFCSACSEGLHKPAKMAAHNITPIPGAPQEPVKNAEDVAPVHANETEQTQPVAATSTDAAAASSATPSAVTSARSAAPLPSTNTPSATPSAAPSSRGNGTAATSATPSAAQSTRAQASSGASSAFRAAAAQHKPTEEEKESANSSSSTHSTPSKTNTNQSSTSNTAVGSPLSATTPIRPRTAMASSASAASLRSSTSSRSRPRTATSQRTLGGNDGTGTANGYPPKLAESLSPTRNILSMTYGNRWDPVYDEIASKPFRGEKIGTFGSANRDSSPVKHRNLLYSKSATDIFAGAGVSERGEDDSASSSSSTTWARLAKPKVFVSTVISPLFDDVKECKFKPLINDKSNELVSDGPNAFDDRLAASVEVFVKRRLRAGENGSVYIDPEATFKPKLSKFKRPQSAGGANNNNVDEMNGRIAFLSRMAEDLADRKKHSEEVAAATRFSFTPTISSSSKKRTAKITTPFLDRLREDLAGRDDGIQSRKEAASRTPFPFQPNAARLAKGNYSFASFLGRMTNDTEERNEKFNARCKKYGLPTPEEVAANIRSYTPKKA